MIQAIRARKSESGFTLIELLIVIVILGILAGVVVFSVGAITDRGTGAACKSDLKSVETAVEAYRAKQGAYPTGADSAARYAKITTEGTPTDDKHKFLRSVPTNPQYAVTIDDDLGNVTVAPLCSTF